jgi:hypothetical protein
MVRREIESGVSDPRGSAECFRDAVLERRRAVGTGISASDGVSSWDFGRLDPSGTSSSSFCREKALEGGECSVKRPDCLRLLSFNKLGVPVVVGEFESCTEIFSFGLLPLPGEETLDFLNSATDWLEFLRSVGMLFSVILDEAEDSGEVGPDGCWVVIAARFSSDPPELVEAFLLPGLWSPILFDVNHIRSPEDWCILIIAQRSRSHFHERLARYCAGTYLRRKNVWWTSRLNKRQVRINL